MCNNDKPMTPILNLPDEPKFTIKTVASQTGIRAVTLRAWERRQDVPHPYRQSNHYRLYSERDIAILRWLKYQVDHGVPISSAANELRYLTNQGSWPEKMPVAVASPAEAADLYKIEQEQSAAYVRNIHAALLAMDAPRANDLLQQIQERLDLKMTCLDIIDPVQREINQAWYRDEISAETWHFANDILRVRLETLLCEIHTGRLSQKIIIACAPMEFSELSPMLLSVLLAMKGYQVEYLGPDIALDDVVDYAEEQAAAMVILSATSEFSAAELEHMRRLLRPFRSGPTFAYYGEGFTNPHHQKQEMPGVLLSPSVQEASDMVSDLLKPRWG